MISELPPLSSANSFTDLTESNDENVEIHYKSGGVYKGMVKNNRRSGKGIFYWIDGSWYDGEYQDNQRSGHGKQLFRDGSLYEGTFVNDLREGIGTQTFINKEIYEGSFYKDFRHGNGNYFWPEATKFQGMFYLSKKEGYGTFTCKTGNVFKGLYKEDERLGPGVLSYSSSRLQDVGLWHGEKLIRIAFILVGGFTLLEHSHCIRLHHEKSHVIHMADCWKTDTLFEETCQEYTYYDILSSAQLSEKLKNIYIDYQDKSSWKINADIFNENFVSAAKGTLDLSADRILWNLTPFLVELQRHSLKHSFKQDLINVDAIFNYNREKFLKKGIIERSSETLLKSTFTGDYELVEAILEENIVCPDVSDRYGIHSLIIATSIGSDDIIELLLNSGANVNQLSDEGCSALTVGIIYCYPFHLFPKNIQVHKIGYLPNYSVGRENEKQCMPICYSNIFDVNNTLFWPETIDNSLDVISQSSATILPKGMTADIKAGQWQDSVVTTLLGKKQNFQQKDIPHIRKSLSSDNKSSPNITIYNHASDERSTKSLTLQPDYSGNKMTDVKGMSEVHLEIKAEESTSRSDVKRGKSEISYIPNLSLGFISSGLKLPKRVSFKDIPKEEDFNIKDNKYRTCVNLLLQRGADPNAAYYPWPVLYFAIRAADVDMVRALLLKNASTSVCLSDEEGGITPLHVACGMPGKEGIQMTELLLNSLADANARAALDNSYLNTAMKDEWQFDAISPNSKLILGGRTPLHIACARNDNFEDAAAVVKLLLEKKANPNVSTNGFSPLALAIAWGNKLAVEELLKNGADPNLELTHGIGNSLCVAVTTQFEDQWNLEDRFDLIEKLLSYGANILTEVPTGTKRVMSSVVDYAHYMFNLDSRIAHLPYHALTVAERVTYNKRKQLLSFLGNKMREAILSVSMQSIIRTDYLPESEAKKGKTLQFAVLDENGEIDNEITEEERRLRKLRKTSSVKYCYDCCRSAHVHLKTCTRCKAVSYCSKKCKSTAWSDRHKTECQGIAENRKARRAADKYDPREKYGKGWKTGKAGKGWKTGKAGKAGKALQYGRYAKTGKAGRFGKAGNIEKIGRTGKLKLLKKGKFISRTLRPDLSDRVLSREEVYGSNYSHN